MESNPFGMKENHTKIIRNLFGYLFCVLLGTSNIVAQVQVDRTSTPICPRSDSVLMSYLQEHGVHTTSRNEVELLPGGKEKFEALFQDIKNARHHIHLEYFNFRNDSIAGALFELLAQKVEEGLYVRALFDDFGNLSNNRPLKKKHLKALREKGIEIVTFDPIRFPYFNHTFGRDHRKIAVIDGKIGYTGGINIADYYVDGLPGIGPWRDMHLRLRGESVAELQQIFLEIWNKTTKQHIGQEAEGAPYFPPLSDSLPYLDVAIVDRVPKKSPKLLRRTLARSIGTACDSVLLVNPYFMPTRIIRSGLKKALGRGVKVEIMISSKGDIPLTPTGSLYVAHKLMKRGADVYMFNEGFHHSKVIMIDGLYSTVGSTNLNSRSLRCDFEMNAFLFNQEITEELNVIYQDDKTKSTYLTPEVWKDISRWKKFVGWFANLLTPFM